MKLKMNFKVINVGYSLSVALLIVIIFDGIGYTSACDLDQAWNGCRIDNGACTCNYGCKSEFRYQTRKECLDALKGRSGDSCNREPCQNKGTCIQISQSPGYRCRCEGTGFYGNRCQRKCPTGEEAYLLNTYPFECVEI